MNRGPLIFVVVLSILICFVWIEIEMARWEVVPTVRGKMRFKKQISVTGEMGDMIISDMTLTYFCTDSTDVELAPDDIWFSSTIETVGADTVFIKLTWPYVRFKFIGRE